jgi:hypothetical protein
VISNHTRLEFTSENQRKLNTSIQSRRIQWTQHRQLDSPLDTSVEANVGLAFHLSKVLSTEIEALNEKGRSCSKTA